MLAQFDQSHAFLEPEGAKFFSYPYGLSPSAMVLLINGAFFFPQGKKSGAF